MSENDPGYAASHPYGEGDEDFLDCQNCGETISMDEYDRTGTDEYCESCPEICSDPRSITFGHHADECDGDCG